MTAPDDAPTTSASGPESAEARAELAAYLAAQGVANDYHDDDLPPDHLPG